MSFRIHQPFLFALPLVVSLFSPCCSSELKTWAVPLTLNSYPAIPVDIVQMESQEPLELVRQAQFVNPEWSADLQATAIYRIDITRRDPSEPLRSYTPLVLLGRQRAAEIGANILYPQRFLQEDGHVQGLRFIAYRVRFKARLLPPALLASLPTAPITEANLLQQMDGWEQTHFGRNLVTENVVDYLHEVHDGTPVRLIFQDGSTYSGTYAGIDEDEVWIKPEGWVGALTHRSFPTDGIQGIGLTN